MENSRSLLNDSRRKVANTSKPIGIANSKGVIERNTHGRRFFLVKKKSKLIVDGNKSSIGIQDTTIGTGSPKQSNKCQRKCELRRS